MGRMLIVAACAMLPACLLFTSLDGASGGSDPSANEAGPDGSGGTDAPASDAGTNDGSPPSDAGFCAQDAGSGTVVCSEFAGTTVSEGFTGLAGGVGTLEINQGNLLAKIPVLDQYEQGRYVFQTINGAFSNLNCSFAFVRTTLGEEDVSIAEFELQTGGDHYSAFVYTAPTHGRLLVYRYPGDGGDGVFEETPIDLYAQPNEWHRIGLEATTTDVRFYVDEVMTASLPHQTPLAAIKTTFKLGMPQIDGDNLSPWELRFDDVRCIRTP